jgi:hypothetical protein
MFGVEQLCLNSDCKYCQYRKKRKEKKRNFIDVHVYNSIYDTLRLYFLFLFLFLSLSSHSVYLTCSMTPWLIRIVEDAPEQKL